MYSYYLCLDLSLNTHIDDLLAFFQNVNKFLFMFMKCKQTQKTNNILLLYLSIDIHIDENVNKLCHLFTSVKPKQMIKSTNKNAGLYIT
jgi:hypothetical protein